MRNAIKSVVGAFALLAAPAVLAQTTLSLVYPFPDQLVYTKFCLELVDKVNKGMGGALKVEPKPFNSIQMFQQPPAASKGVVDLVCTPSAFYTRAIPENEAISTSNSSPAKVRANGGMQIIDELHQKLFNLKYVGWTESGGRFRIYLKEPPKFTAQGLPDFRGVKLRDNPIYGAFFRALNASTHSMSSNDVYPALEKGVVNASAWATIGLKDYKWDQFLRHAVEPEFYQVDIGWIMNLDKWKSLPANVQKQLVQIVAAHEISAHAALEKMAQEERATLAKEGMKFHQAPDAQAYLKIAVDSAYDRMTQRIKESGRDTAHVAKLRALFIE
ncbi:MAG TPA: TRAP transporter substrate-binding protein DctP [Burkholderiales bacterium]|nr:TRAP transporter substrate-binding protein DctP [Burkholderiales bacterium]